MVTMSWAIALRLVVFSFVCSDGLDAAHAPTVKTEWRISEWQGFSDQHSQLEFKKTRARIHLSSGLSFALPNPLVPRDDAAADLLSILRKNGRTQIPDDPVQRTKLAKQLSADLVKALRVKYSCESKFQSVILRVFWRHLEAIKGQRSGNNATIVNLTETLSLCGAFKNGESGLNGFQKGLALISAANDAALAVFEIAAGKEMPRTVRGGETLSIQDMLTPGLGRVAQLTNSLFILSPVIRATCAYRGPVCGAVLGCKDKDNCDVAATAVQVSPPLELGTGWSGQIVSSVRGNDETAYKQVANVIFETLARGVRVHAASRDGAAVGVDADIPGTTLEMSPFLNGDRGRMSNGELHRISDHEACWRALRPSMMVDGLSNEADFHDCALIKTCSAESLIGWKNRVSRACHALQHAVRDDVVKAKVRKVVKIAGGVRDMFFMAMPDLATQATHSVTREHVKLYWQRFCDDIVFGTLVRLVRQGVIFSDIRPNCSKVRWEPADQQAGSMGGFLLWDWDALMHTSLGDFPRFTEQGDGRIVPDKEPINFVFAQTLLVAFCADQDINEEQLMAQKSHGEQAGLALWSPEQPRAVDDPHKLRLHFDGWLDAQEAGSAPGLKGAVNSIRNRGLLLEEDLCVLRRLSFSNATGASPECL